MTAQTFFANRGTVTIAGATSEGTPTPSATTCGVVKDVEITVSADHVPLYGWGSILRQAVAKHSLKVSVKVGWMKFDPDVTAGVVWAIGASPNLNGNGSWANINQVHLFDIVATFVGEGGTTLTATATNVYFPNLPIKASEGQWIKMDLSGEASGIVFS